MHCMPQSQFPCNPQAAVFPSIEERDLAELGCNNTLSLVAQSSHKQYISKWAWLCTNKTLFVKIGSGLDLDHGF